MTTQFVSLKVTERKLKSKKKKVLGLLLGIFLFTFCKKVFLFLTLIGMKYESKKNDHL